MLDFNFAEHRQQTSEGGGGDSLKIFEVKTNVEIFFSIQECIFYVLFVIEVFLKCL